MSDPTFCQGYSGKAVDIRGSFRGVLSRVQCEEFFTSFSIWLDIPGHLTDILART